MGRLSFFMIVGLLLASLVISYSPAPAFAQLSVGSGSSSNAQQLPALPDPLTPEAVRELVSKLSDQQVRDLLLERLDAVARRDAAAATEQQSVLGVITGAAKSVAGAVTKGISATPAMPAGVAKAWGNFMGGRGASGFLMFLAIVAVSIGLGLAAGLVVDQLTKSHRARFEQDEPEGLWPTMRNLLHRFLFDMVKVLAFAVVSIFATQQLHASLSDAQFAQRFITNIVILVLVFAAFSRFVMAPRRPEWRLISVDDEGAKRFHWQTIWVAFLIGAGPFTIQSIVQFGIPMGTLRLGFWFTFILHAVVILFVYQSRAGIRQACRGSDNLLGRLGKRTAENWPWISMVLVGINWLFIEILAGAGRFDLLRGQQFVTLVLIVFFPLLDTTIRGLVRHLSPPLLGEGYVAEQAHISTQRSFLRMGRVVLLAMIMLLIAGIFGIDLWNLESANFTERLVAQFIDGVLYFLIGYFIWEAAGVWINRRLAKEQTEAGMDLNSDEPGGGEGGGAGLSRLATVLPILRLVVLSVIAVMTVLLGLSKLGIDTTPLLAGAGIVGLAIGFGAQTLVRDVVSGIFFLTDDAFRVGEYLVIGDTVGTVEKISIRSLQLRHHQGPIHTIPYGEIPRVTNNSRDWVIMKLKFTFPFETDVNRIKKIFKQVGAEMMEADYADDLIQTFKSQGVYDVDDVGIVIRGKFMAKPGTQWIIRKDIYTRVQKALDAADIQFARREVRVQIPGLGKGDNISEDQAKSIAAAASEATPEPAPGR